MDYLEVQVKQRRAMGVDELLDMPQSVDLFGIVLCVLVRKHDEAFMVIDSTQGAQVKGGLVAGIKMGEADEQGIKGGAQANIPAMLASL
jgi:hypothetical protein